MKKVDCLTPILIFFHFTKSGGAYSLTCVTIECLPASSTNRIRLSQLTPPGCHDNRCISNSNSRLPNPVDCSRLQDSFCCCFLRRCDTHWHGNRRRRRISASLTHLLSSEIEKENFSFLKALKVTSTTGPL